MKKNYYAIINVILFIIMLITVYSTFKAEFGETYNDKYTVIKKSLETIENNMEEMTSNSSWDSMKELSKADSIQKEAYNKLVADIKDCYVEMKDLDQTKVDNIKILDFETKRSASKKDLKNIYENNKCIDSFAKYDSVKFSKNDDLNTKLQKQISLIMNMTPVLSSDDIDFDSVISRETNIIHNVANLSNWLKIEYDTYK